MTIFEMSIITDMTMYLCLKMPSLYFFLKINQSEFLVDILRKVNTSPVDSCHTTFENVKM